VGRSPGPVGGPGGGPAGGMPGVSAAAPVEPSQARGAMAFAVPPGQLNQAQPAGSEASKDRRDGPEMLFWVHMFPIGHMPVVSDRPARQLPPPPVDLDYAPGMRFEPGDHPEHHRVEGEQRLAELRAGVPPLSPSEGLVGDHPLVAGLVDGYDPLGGQHERDWDRRYLVRLGSVTPQGISEEGKEYAWPPGEVYPEGGTAPGEAEVLAEGTVIDRFGPPDGRVFSADETEFARRSLPPEWVDAGYRRYRVTRALPVWRTVSAPWFGQPGGGERYRTTYPAVELQALGYLADITGGGE
jgi:Tuberculosis necrotizing toxin